MRKTINKSQHLFSQVPTANISRSVFDRSHGYKTTFDEGYLVPFYVDEVLPGDTFNLKASVFARLATPIVPLMDNMVLNTEFFFVPCRLLWEHWENMFGQQDKPTDTTDYICPTLTIPAGGFNVGSLYDYMGIPTGTGVGAKINTLPLRAYNLIYNEWYRDQNLIDSVPVRTGDSGDLVSDYTLLKRAKYHDYFTSALPWPQKGPGVEMPLGGNAPLVYGPKQTGSFNYLNGDWDASGKPVFSISGTVSSNKTGSFSSSSGTGTGSTTYPSGYQIFADLGSASPVTINSLRQAFQLQKYYEALARSGSRYCEFLQAMFSVKSPDARLQRPEYLGGSKTRVGINQVAQSSASDSVTPQGNLAAYGLVGDTFHGFNHSFVEHGYIIGIVSVQADLTYQQGLNRMWSRSGFEDFYLPVFAHLGEQAVLNKEIYLANESSNTNDGVFGYQERFAEYRYYPSQITGKMRSTYAQPLDMWHLAQKFDSLPVLGKSFIEENAPVSRAIAVPSEPHFIFDSYINLKCVRPMPVYSVPGLVDHF